MLGTPYTAGDLIASTSATSYSMPATAPVPAGAMVVVFAGASGATTVAGVTDSQGNTYTLAASSTSDQYLQAFTATLGTALNPLNADQWTVTYTTANTQGKLALAIAVTGAAATDITVAANGSSATASASGPAADGNEIAVACWQSASSSITPASPFSGLGGAGTGGVLLFAGTAPVTMAGAVTAAAAVTSGPWAAILVTLTAAAPAALGSGQSPYGGVTLPPYPVLPAPRTWSAGDQFWTPRLRADPGNAITLLTQPPLYIGGQTTTGQSVTTATVTPLDLDTDLMDSWACHVQPAATLSPPLAGWYLCEGFVNLSDLVTGTTAAAGIQAVQGGVTASTDGGRVSSNGVNSPVPCCADLIQADPATGDTVALYAWQNSGAAKTVTSAYFKAEWVCAPSGTLVTSPVPAAGWTTGSTVLLTAVSAGATQILLGDPTGVAAGAAIQLDRGNTAADTVTVTSVSGQTIGISACAYPHPAGAPVATPVSAAFTNQQIRDKINFLSYRPAARLSNSGVSQNLAAQTWPAGTAVQWAAPGSTAGCTDNFSGWSSASPTRYTFPVSGTWYLAGQVYCTDASSTILLSAGIAISGGTIRWGDRTASAGVATGAICATVRRAAVRVTAGQYAEVYGSQSYGTLALQDSGATFCKLIAVWRGF